MSDHRTVYSEEFLHSFKMLYAKYGRDALCVENLRSKYPQYVDLSTNLLCRIRQKRKEEFRQARQEHIQEVTQVERRVAQELLVKATALNHRSVEFLLEVQDRFLTEFETLDPTDEKYLPKLNALANNIVNIQDKINTFAGIDLDNQLRMFKQKLLAKKIAEEKALDEVIRVFTNGVTGISVEATTQQGRPKLKFHTGEEE